MIHSASRSHTMVTVSLWILVTVISLLPNGSCLSMQRPTSLGRSPTTMNSSMNHRRHLPRPVDQSYSRHPTLSPPYLRESSLSSTNSNCSTDNPSCSEDENQPLSIPPITNSSPKRWPFLLSKVSSFKKALVLGTAAASCLLALAAFPFASHAIDWAALTGGAATWSSETGSLLSSFQETGFYQAFSLVFLSEIGDKTFFIAGLLAAKTSRFISFVGSLAALTAMTIVSVIIGQVFHAVPSGFGDGLPLDDIAAAAAFAFFGIKTLKEALEMDEGSSTMDEELEDAQEAVEGSSTISTSTAWGQIASIFALVFAAEFGDRSFLSTIALSAAQNPVSVAVGGIAAHAAATGIAVSGGAVAAKYVSEKVIGIIGGSLFLVFAVTTVLGIF